jgi:hypothetical protein
LDEALSLLVEPPVMALAMFSSLPGSMRSKASASASVVEPTADDVFMGRGNAHSWRPGNARFHRIVDQYIHVYHSTTRKGSKGEVIARIYDSVNSKGRFLKDLDGGGYAEIDEEDAKRKIGQAVRYRKHKADSSQELTESTATEGSDSVEPRAGDLVGADYAGRHGTEREDPSQEEELFSDGELISVLGESAQDLFL